MSVPPSSQTTVWASELIGALVTALSGPVAHVTGLVMLPPQGVMALRVQPSLTADPPSDQACALLLPFEAALAYAPGEVRVASADDVVPAFKLPTLLGHLTSLPSSFLGSPVRTTAGRQVGFLWDALLDRVTGELLIYRLGPTTRPPAGARGILASGRVCHCVQGGLTIQEPYVALVSDLVNPPHNPPDLPSK